LREARVSRSPKAELQAHGLVAKKEFGQCFLADAQLASRIAELCCPSGGTVIELGAGLGALTRPLLERAGRLIAVERDRDLVPVLRQNFEPELGEGRLVVLEADAKTLELGPLFEGGARPHVLAGNLPYQITGPLITLSIHARALLDRAVFLVQLEVGDRLAARAGADAYGALSVFTQAAFEVERALVVRRGAFYPQPNVDSCVVVLTPRARPIAETEVFRALVKQAFGMRRKKLINAWNGVAETTRAELGAERAGIDLDRRGEELGVEDFERMANALEAEVA
jgi:16S rRNA (adenine1518-N6/adenine1519-N6)-dimethyltransferase